MVVVRSSLGILSVQVKNQKLANYLLGALVFCENTASVFSWKTGASLYSGYIISVIHLWKVSLYDQELSAFTQMI